MDVGLIGLGKMGLGIGERLARRDHRVFGWDKLPETRMLAAEYGISWVDSPASFAEALRLPRIVFVMVPAGEAVDEVIALLAGVLSHGDVLIDGGNSLYTDSIRRAGELKERGIRLLDVGVSGGVWGREHGFCLMVGGEKTAFELAQPVLGDLACDEGYAYLGPSGAGHFAKMAHNGIEYGILQSLGEGFEILAASGFDYDLAGIAGLWNQGSVIRSWLLELARIAFEDSPRLEQIRGWVEDTGEGRWAVSQAIQEGVPAPVIAASLMMRLRSRQEDSFSARLIAALRHRFGGHPVIRPE